MTKKITLILISSIVILCGCWKKQQHEITAPEIPVYTLSGSVFDMDSGENLSDIIVSLSPVDMIYDYDFSGAIDTSDAKGRFEFLEITPGSYQITCLRNSFAVVDEQIVLDHADKETAVALPKALVARNSYAPPEFPAFQGIAWKNSDTFAGVGQFRDNPDDPIHNALASGSFTVGFKKLGSARYTRDNPPFFALAYLGRFWTTDGSENKTRLWSIDPARGRVDGEIQVEFGLRDLTSDKRNLWATTSLGKIVKFGEHPSKVEQTFDVEASQPYGIALADDGMWITDLSRNLVLKLDKNLKPMASFRPFGWDENTGIYTLSNLLYLAMDYSGNLWANNGTATFKFDLD